MITAEQQQIDTLLQSSRARTCSPSSTAPSITHWYLKSAPQLSEKARGVFLAGEQGQARILIPSIVLAELYYLNVKYNRPLDFTQEYQKFGSAGQFRFTSKLVQTIW